MLGRNWLPESYLLLEMVKRTEKLKHLRSSILEIITDRPW